MVAAGKIFLLGPMSGVMQGITVWIDYMSYATMHFCQILFQLIFACFDALVYMSYYKDLKYQLKGNPFY